MFLNRRSKILSNRKIQQLDIEVFIICNKKSHVYILPKLQIEGPYLEWMSVTPSICDVYKKYTCLNLRQIIGKTL